MGDDFGSAFWESAQRAQDMRLKRETFKDMHADRRRKALTDYTDKLSEVLANPDMDDSARSAATDSLLAGIEQERGKPLSKTFRSFVLKNPEDASTIIDTLSKGGFDAKKVLDISDDPLLFAHTLMAYGRAKKAKQTGMDRSEAPGEGPAASTTASPPTQEPGGQGLGFTDLTGQRMQRAQPFAQRPMGDVMGGPGAEAQLTPVPTAPAGPDAQLADETNRITQRMSALSTRINSLAARGVDESLIKPFRDQRTALEAEMRKIRTDAPLAAVREREMIAQRPVDQADLQMGRTAAERAQRPDVAARFVPGMRRSAYDAVMAHLTDQQPLTAAGPGADPTANTVPGVKKPLIESKEEALTEEQRIKRQQAALPEAQLRDPLVQAAGLSTVGQLEAARKPGVQTLRTSEEIVNADSAARERQQAGFKRFEEIVKAGDAAQGKLSQLETIKALYRQVGPTGQLVGPLRQRVFDVLQLFNVEPAALAKIQTMDAANLQLVRATLKDFSGNDSDRDVLTAMSANPGKMKTKEANQAMLALATHTYNMDKIKSVNAKRWDSMFGSIANKNSRGQTFEDAWDEEVKTIKPVISDDLMKAMGIKRKAR